MIFDPSEKEVSALNTGRLMRAESDVIGPLLERQKQDVISGLCNAFRAGQLDMLPVFTAQLVSIENMKAEIKNKIAKAENIERKIFNAGSNRPK